MTSSPPTPFSMVVCRLAATLLLVTCSAVVNAQDVLTPQLFRAGMLAGDYDAVIDVRSESEWDTGHIENATLVANLASSGTPDSILGCQNCTLAIYCQSGNRAGRAIERLQTEFGFEGTLYNALGASNWVSAGFPLVNTDPATFPCQTDECDSCELCADDNNMMIGEEENGSAPAPSSSPSSPEENGAGTTLSRSFMGRLGCGLGFLVVAMAL